ncbi:OLC1v1010268C1 [Oldenlandia corymbosa var. corymbosa]|uniref:Potassium channel n=1 Tax=Oldenlandia corymbosa var. corymbosa TaxID=529605 RepID=A0AAV1DR71_OLDCO|nr:OLC1v1010268C1 [Oldenlandia corymbosa var. corymbosa]
MGRKNRGKEEEEEEGGSSNGSGDGEYEVDDLRDKIQSSRGSRFALIKSQFGYEAGNNRRLSRENLIKGVSHGYIDPQTNRWYRAWEKFILIWALYSSCFTPLEFGFFRGLPKKLFVLDIVGQVAFFIDIILHFFVAYLDTETYVLVKKRTPIAIRYMRSHFIIDLLGCMPWDIIYKAAGGKEWIRYLLWIRLSRVRKLTKFFQNMEKDIRINYLFTRIIKLIAVELYCTHTAACIFYYLATTIPEEKEGYTWIGSLQLGDYHYSHFREIDLWKRYITSMYFAIVTMATVGYGDIHAVNVREMIFVMIYVSFDMILGAYLIGNMTALIVKGSKTERYRDKMTDLLKYMNRNRLGKDIRNQIKGHLRLQYERSYTDAVVLQDIPVSIRAKISQRLYRDFIESIDLFDGCSAEFINQIVIRLHEEFFLPGEVIMEQGNAVDQLYFVKEGSLEEISTAKDGSEESSTDLKPGAVFGIIAILFNIPQPKTVRVCELCVLLRIDKQSFSNILEVYFHDGRRILSNLSEGKDSVFGKKQLETDIGFHITKQEAELALRVNSASYYGDLQQLKDLIRAGADPNKTDYDGRSPLHLAASRGYEDIVQFLIQEGMNVNIADNFGNTPLLEAIKNGHENIATLLVNKGASLQIENAGNYLCMVVLKGDADFLRRLLSRGIDPNSKDYDERTPLHVAASQGFYIMAKILLDAGASVLSKDRWGNTPLDEARITRNKKMVSLLEAAKPLETSELPDAPDRSQEITDKRRRIKCTVFPFHPWESKDARKVGIVLWVPSSMEDLIREASEQLNVSSCSCLLTEDGGKIVDVNMISDGQKLFMMRETD